MTIDLSKAVIIDDNTNINSLITYNQGRGYVGMWENEGLKASAGTFSDIGIPLIPEKDWDDHIRQIQKDRDTIPELCDDFNLEVKNQKSTNYCWIFAPARCCEIMRLKELGRKVYYSPASCGAPIKNFRNVGGWGSQGLERLKVHGINESEDWPDTAISRSYFTQENIEKAKMHIALSYFYLKSWVEMGSCILAGIPTANGYPWWSHEVTGVELLLGDHDLVIDNSWSTNWGDRGRGVLKGNRKIPSDCVAIVSMSPI